MSGALDVPRCPECGRYPVDHRDGKCIYRPRSAGPATIITALSVDLSVLSREHFVWGGADKRKVVEVIDRMLADLVRLRGLHGAAPVLLTAGQYDVVLLALADAEILHRTSGDPDKAAGYQALAVELAKESGQ